jgi:hypothetical protein
MTRTDDYDDYVYCTSEGEKEQTPEEDDDDTVDEPRALTENNDEDDDEEEDVWKADDDLSLSTGIDRLGYERTIPVTTEIAALRTEIRILKQTLAAQRLTDDLLLRRRVTAAGIPQERQNHGAVAGRFKYPPLQDKSHHQDIPAQDRPNLWRNLDHPDATTRKIILTQLHLVSICFTFLGCILLNGGADHICVPFLKLCLCSRQLLCTIGRNWVGDTMERKEPIDNTRLLLWVVLCIVEQPHNSSTTLLAALLASLVVDYASDMKHCIRMNNKTVPASVDFMIKSFIEWETYTGLPLLVLMFLHESTLLPQAYAFLAMQTLVSIALQLNHHHVRSTPVMVLSASAWGLYRLCGFWLYFALVVGGFGVYAFQPNSTQRQAAEAKKRD